MLLPERSTSPRNRPDGGPPLSTVRNVTRLASPNGSAPVGPADRPAAGAPTPGSSPVLRGYGQYVDGLYTYCLSVLCEHDAAVAAVAEARDLALRYGHRLADPALLRAWLYALARHCCLARLERGVGPTATPSPARAAERRAELASLAWPEAAGTDPEQREALELAVRHRLDADEVAAVLGLSGEAAVELLAAAGAEVDRTRTALLVLGVGSCPELARLGGVGAESWRGWVLGPALRRELVRHVVDCPTCRGTAERVAGELGHGLAALPGLPLLTAPVTVRLGGTPAPRLPGGAAGAAFLAGAAAGRRAVALAAAGRTGRHRSRGARPTGGPGAAGPGAAGPGSAGRTARGSVAGGPVTGGPGQARSGPGDPSGGRPGGGSAAGGLFAVVSGTGLPIADRPGVPVGAARAADAADGGTAAGTGRRAGQAAGVGAASEPAGGLASAQRPAAWLPPEPRFDQRGFPRHRAQPVARVGVVRQRVVTTGVLAAVLTAPVVALWGAHRDGGGAGASAPVSSVRVDAAPQPDAPAAPAVEDARPPADGAVPAAALQLVGAVAAETSLPPVLGPLVPVPAHGAKRLAGPALTAEPVATSPSGTVPAPEPARPGQLTVEAGEYAGRTVITLINSGGTDIQWHAVMDVDWLRLSRDSGALAPGQRITVTVTLDETRAPQTQWTARIALPPSEAVVTLQGGPSHRGGQTPSPTPTDPSPSPSPDTSPDTSPTSRPPASPSPSTAAPESTSPTPTAPATPSAQATP